MKIMKINDLIKYGPDHRNTKLLKFYQIIEILVTY